MKSFALVLIASFVAFSGLSAEDRPSIDLKKKSSFQVDGNSRNPFWPIGFKPTASVAHTSGAPGSDIPWSAFLLTSITVDQGTHFAIINGKSMQEGQQFTLQAGSQTYQLKVKSIEDGRVILSNQDREIIVPLRRK
jgi:hypothetical protein